MTPAKASFRPNLTRPPRLENLTRPPRLENSLHPTETLRSVFGQGRIGANLAVGWPERE